MTTQTGPLLLAALALVLGLPLAQGAAEHPQERSYVAPAGLTAVPLAQSAAVRTGNTLYLAGHVGLDPLTQQVPAQRATEARLLMQAVERTVTAAGLQMDDVVSVTVFSTDPTADEIFNAEYQAHFHGHYPARAVVGASRLARGAHFELSAVAVRPPHLRL
jgi:2-iminobutanoate/2-iminopropanoate deaminase